MFESVRRIFQFMALFGVLPCWPQNNQFRTLLYPRIYALLPILTNLWAVSAEIQNSLLAATNPDLTLTTALQFYRYIYSTVCPIYLITYAKSITENLNKLLCHPIARKSSPFDNNLKKFGRRCIILNLVYLVYGTIAAFFTSKGDLRSIIVFFSRVYTFMSCELFITFTLIIYSSYLRLNAEIFEIGKCPEKKYRLKRLINFDLIIKDFVDFVNSTFGVLNLFLMGEFFFSIFLTELYIAASGTASFLLIFSSISSIFSALYFITKCKQAVSEVSAISLLGVISCLSKKKVTTDKNAKSQYSVPGQENLKLLA